MGVAKKSDIEKMTTVSQFGHFGFIFSSLGGVPDKGGIPKVYTLEEGPPPGTLEPILGHFWDLFWSI